MGFVPLTYAFYLAMTFGPRSSLECPWSAPWCDHHLFHHLFDININDDDIWKKLWWYLMIWSSNKSWNFLAHPDRCIKAAWRNFGSCYDCFHLWGKSHRDQTQGNGLLDSHDLGLKGVMLPTARAAGASGKSGKKSTNDTEKDAEKSREHTRGQTKTHLRMFPWYWLGLQPVLIQKLSPIDDAFFWTIMKWSKQMRKKQNLILFVKYCSWNHVTVPSI